MESPRFYEFIPSKDEPLPDAANDDEYIEERENRRPTKVEDAAAKQWLLQVPSYADYLVLTAMYKRGLVAFSDGIPSFDPVSLRGAVLKNIFASVGVNRSRLTIRSIYDALSNNGMLDMSYDEFVANNSEGKPDSRKGKLMRPLALPASLGGLLVGEEGERTYSGKDGGGWTAEITLADGTVTTPFEIVIARALRANPIRKEADGDVFLEGKFAGKRVTFDRLRRIAGHLASSIQLSSREVYECLVPNLRARGMITEEYFDEHTTGTESHHLRKFERNRSKDFSVRTPAGSSKYYIGADKYVHNKKLIPERTAMMPLDNDTIGVLEDDHGVSRLKYVFPAMTDEEDQKERLRIAEKFSKSPADLTPSEISTQRRKRVDPATIDDYQVTDYITPYNDESPKSYAQRVLFAANNELVTNTLGSVFVPAKVDHFAFSWGEKIRLAEVVNELSKDEVVEFARAYGPEGLHALFASETDKSWPSRVIAAAKEHNLREAFEYFAPFIADEREFGATLRSTVTKHPEIQSYLADLRTRSLGEIVKAMERVFSGEENLDEVKQKFHGQHLKFALVKMLKHGGHIESIKDVEGVTIDEVSGADLSQEDRDLLEAMYRTSYPDKKFQEKLLENWNEVSRSPKNTFTILRHEGKIVGFYRMEDRGGDPPRSYFASFNVDKNFRGSALGASLLAESIGSCARERLIDADCDVREPISAQYIESGFVATKIYDFEGRPSLRIVRDDALREATLVSSLYGKEDIAARVQPGEQLEDGNMIFSAALLEDIQKLPFGLIDVEGSQPCVLSRYFRREAEGDRTVVYAVFERVPKDKLDAFVRGVPASSEANVADEEDGAISSPAYEIRSAA